MDADADIDIDADEGVAVAVGTIVARWMQYLERFHHP